MIVENKLTAWLQAGLDLYKTNPLLVESVFFDQAQVGWPTFPTASTVLDAEKRWLPNEYARGVFRWGGQDLPIVSNTGDTLTVDGDASAILPDAFPYQIVPPDVAVLQTFLATETCAVLSTFAQVPTHFPAITIRLEKDEQGDTYLGDSLEQYAINGIEFDVRSQALQGNYLLSIWTVNREATLYLYAWLQHYILNSMPAFATWGLYDVSVSGSDLDPALQYLAERAYVRHLLLTASRVERAVSTRSVEWVSGFAVTVLAEYARLATTVVPAMD